MRWCFVVALALVGCGSDSQRGSPDPEPCLPPNRLAADECLAPGVQDDGCPAGTLAVDGSCQAAGIPADGCAEGFAHDGDVGCEPVLPAEPCPEGLMAVPGESACHLVMGCGEGTWGDIPVDASTIYVDAGHDGASDGTAGAPFDTINAALDAADAGDLVAVGAGTYDEDLQITKPVRLWGVCPERAIVAGAGGAYGAIEIRSGASGTEVRGLAITGDNPVALIMAGSQDILLSHLWVHDAVGPGLVLDDILGPASATVTRTLVERSHDVGILALGSAITVDQVVVRDVQPRITDQRLGRGIGVQLGLNTGLPATAEITGSVVERCHDAGVSVAAAEATLEGVVLRDTLPESSDGLGGRAIVAVSGPEGVAKIAVTGAMMERNHETGVSLQGAEASLDRVVVRDTLPRPDGLFGRGVGIQPDAESDRPSSLVLAHSVIERSHQIGLFAAGSEARLVGVVVRDTLPQQADLLGGRGVHLQNVPSTGQPSTATMIGSTVERSYEAAMTVVSSSADLSGVVLHGTSKRASDDLLGDGMAVVSDFGPASAVVTASLLRDNVRGGLSSFGAQVSLGSTALRCNGFDLAVETYLDQPGAFDDLGKNGCGCPELTATCKAVSAGLMPPTAVGR